MAGSSYRRSSTLMVVAASARRPILGSTAVGPLVIGFVMAAVPALSHRGLVAGDVLHR